MPIPTDLHTPHPTKQQQTTTTKNNNKKTYAVVTQLEVPCLVLLAPDKGLFFSKNLWFFFIIISVQKKKNKQYNTEVLQMSSHNLCFIEEIRKIFILIPPISWVLVPSGWWE